MHRQDVTYDASCNIGQCLGSVHLAREIMEVGSLVWTGKTSGIE